MQICMQDGRSPDQVNRHETADLQSGSHTTERSEHMAPTEFMLQQLSSFSMCQAPRRTTHAQKTRPSERDFASVLECIAERRARGETFASIAAHLNKLGLRGRNGSRLYPATVRAYLMRS